MGWSWPGAPGYGIDWRRGYAPGGSIVPWQRAPRPRRVLPWRYGLTS